MSKLWLYLVIGCTGLAAQVVISGLPREDLDEKLLQEKYHIAPTEQGLIGALQHPSGSVRIFAAMKLALDGDKAAIRPILDALAVEKAESIRITQAAAAAELGSEEGSDFLKNMCGDRSSSPALRMRAAQTMVQVVGREECFSDVLDVLRSGDAVEEGDSAVTVALNLLTFSGYKHIPPSQLDETRLLCAGYLKNENPGLRMFAGMCIRDQGGPWAISQLRAAIAAEPAEAIRNSLEKDLLSVRQ